MSKQHQGLRKRLLVVMVAGAIGCAGVATAAVPVGGKFAVLTKATQLNRGDVIHGAMPISGAVHVTVALKLRNHAQLESFLARAKQPGTPAAQRVMSRATLVADHLPTTAQAQAVADFLTHSGFTNVHVSADRMLVLGDASVAAAQAAFKTTLVKVQTRDGRKAFANSAPIQIPAALQSSVQAVLGLQTVHKAHILARAKPASAIGISGHQPLEFADIYDASGLHPATDVNVAVWGWGSMQQTLTDLGDFTNSNHLPVVKTLVVCSDYNGHDAGGVVTNDPTCNNVDQGSVEWDLDSQDIVAMSGGVKSLTFYAAYGGFNDSISNSLDEIVSPTAGEPLAQVINASFGECERDQDVNQGGDGSAQTDDAFFKIAAARGQTFTVSTGDSGSDECGDGLLNSASYPASSPWVVAVSGTTLRASTTTWARENVWLDAGGSPSSFEAAQPWQAGLTYGPYAGTRGPDVAFDANPSSGAIIINAGQSIQVGGTSLAAPLFAGAWARILQGNPKLGFAAPHLYALPASALHDVLSGNNHGYIAKGGWDWATGLGSLDVGKAAAALAPQH